MEMKANITWVNFYIELANKLLLYKDNRKELIEKIKTIHDNIDKPLPKLEIDNDIVDIDPFTIFGLFNKGITDANRIAILKEFAKEFSIKEKVPENFSGIPVLNNQKATFYFFKGERQLNDIDNLWNVYAAAIEYVDTNSDISKNNFIESYDLVLKQKGVKWNLTMGLFWIRPYDFINLDSINRECLIKYNILPDDFIKLYGALKNVPNGSVYIDIINRVRDVISQNDCEYSSFPELSHYAFVCSQKIDTEKMDNISSKNSDTINDNKDDFVSKAGENMPKYPKNLILYGPPGTGKTYNSVNYAVAIIESKDIDEVIKEDRKAVLKRYNKYKNDGLINFCTFHQSFGYEEFIEGIKPKTTEDNKVIYKYTDGVFKEFCEKKSVERSIGFNDRPTVWKIVLQKTTDNTIKKECLENNHIRIGYGDDKSYDEIVNENDNGVVKDFVENIAIGDIVVVHCYPNSYDAIGVVTSEFRKDESFTEFKQIRDVKWLLKDGTIRNVDTICEKFDTRATIARISTANLNEILNLIKKFGVLSKEDNDIEPNKVFIIDEINRGNISKIFGELITLLEDSKRIGADEELIISLPYSKKPFGVPNNVYLLGTMNTADRSIALIDTALRRRFKFVEMQPDAELVDVEVAGVKIKEMLEMINRRIEVLYDREHTIGHSFFMGLSNESTIEDLAEVFDCNVIPLLKEYFYDDYERIAAVLGDNLIENNEATNFIIKQENDYAKILNSDITVMPAYKFNREALKNSNAYKKIYK